MSQFFFKEASMIKHQMNNLGRQGVPFLFAVDFEMKQGLVLMNPLKQDVVLFRIPGVSNVLEEPLNHVEISIKQCDSVEQYSRKFSLVMKGLLRGNSYVTNLTSRSKIITSSSLHEIFTNSSSPYGLYVPGFFLSYSPERFVRIDGDKLFSSPMKGTIDASLPGADRSIINNYKERCEHNAIVDLIRNDVGSICDHVSVERFRYISEINTASGSILQVSSDITGVLPTDKKRDFGDIIFAMLPAGSVSGAPKQATCKIIQEAEKEERGFYTGVFGYFDGNVLDSGVLIRFIEVDSSGDLWYRSGGGITVNSTCEEEYLEMLSKIYIPKVKI